MSFPQNTIPEYHIRILNNRDDGYRSDPLNDARTLFRQKLQSKQLRIHDPLLNTKVRKGMRNMTDIKLFRNNMNIPTLFGGAMNDKTVPFDITDTFENSNVKSLLYGKQLTTYHKNVILSVLYELSRMKTPQSSSRFESNLQAKQRIHEFIIELMNDKSLMFDALNEAFKSKSVECMLAYALLAYQTDDDDMMLRTMYTFGRVLPLKEKNQWFDNYRLNAYGNIYNLTMYKSIVDKIKENDQNAASLKHIYDIDVQMEPINEQVVFEPAVADKLLCKLAGTLREHIIKCDLLPNEVNTSKLLTVQDIENASGKMKNMTVMEVLDKCYQNYPFYYGGCHGCDCFTLGLTPTIAEIKLFIDRYPSARIGFILNTATYRSGRGEHWMALMLMKNKAMLMCSQQGTFDDFHDEGVLKQSIIDNGFALENNNEKIQQDNHSCGMQSVIALMEMLRFGEIKSASDAIGVNMTNLGKDIGKECNTEKVIEKLAGSK